MFIVNLKKATFDEKLQSRPIFFFQDHQFLGLYALKDVLERSLHDTSSFLQAGALAISHILGRAVLGDGGTLQTGTLDCVSFTSACLAVSENSAIVALHATICDWPRNVVKYRHLINRWVPHEIKVEDLALLSELKFDLCSRTQNFYAASVRQIIDLALIKGSDPDDNLDVIGMVCVVRVK